MAYYPQLLVLLISGIFLSSLAACPKGWIKRPHGSCYKFVNSPGANWPTAQSTCKGMGGGLARLETEDEIIWMRGYRSYHRALRVGSWIGGYEQDGKWFWKDPLADVDSPITVADWAESQPDNLAGNQHCLQLFGEKTYLNKPAYEWFKFDDAACEAKLPFICEINDD